MRHLAAGLVLAAAGLTGGCAASATYMGVNLAAPGLPADLRDLGNRAQAGDKRAQLELGIAFEEGYGVAPDLDRAAALYRVAASNDPGRMWIYVPSPGGGAPAQVMPIDRPARPGLAEARMRLAALDGKRQK